MYDCPREEAVLVIVGRGGCLFISQRVDEFGTPAIRYYTPRYKNCIITRRLSMLLWSSGYQWRFPSIDVIFEVCW